MIIPDTKIGVLTRFIREIYTDTLNQERLLRLASLISELVDSHYFGLLLYPNVFIKQKYYFSNNDKSYVELYSSIVSMDFLMKNLIHGAGISVLNAFPDDVFTGNMEFSLGALRGRPVADLCYAPLSLDGYRVGHMAVSRAGLTFRIRNLLDLRGLDSINSPYSRNEIKQIIFLAGFVNDALTRALAPPVAEEDTAYADAFGKITVSGLRMRDTLKRVFGDRYWNYPSQGPYQNHTLFADAFRGFLLGPHLPRKGEARLTDNGGTLTISFAFLPSNGLRPYFPKEPQVKMTLREETAGAAFTEENFPLDLNVERLELTPREGEIVRCICRGMSNREISENLKIAEATVKRHLYNTFEKAGVRSRTELMFKAGGGK